MNLLWIYVSLVLCGLVGAYGTKLFSGEAKAAGVAVLLAQGTVSVLLWIVASSRGHNIVVLSAVWDAVYVLAWAVGLSLIFRCPVTPVQALGIALIIAGTVVVNLK